MTDQPSSWAEQPVVICTYGPSGIGKSTDMGYSFPNALFIAAPGALNSVHSLCGYTPKSTWVNTISDATELIQAAAGKFHTVVIDDFSFLAEQTFSALEKKYNGFRLWGELRDAALRFRDTSRMSGVNVIMNCWEQAPKNKPDGSRVRGGPMLSGRLPEQIPALCDVVLRAVHEPRNQPWPAVYRCNPDPNFVMKDRFHTASVADPAPMNLGEILRSSGLNVPRHPAMNGQEQEVAAISSSLTGVVKDDTALINEVYTSLVANGQAVAKARWTLRDALDRAVLRRAKAQAEGTFLTISTTLS
jgi:hypothetical protein